MADIQIQTTGELTDRQKEILMAVIEEFMKDAQEVGSTELLKKHGFKVSSATIRNEMVKLMNKGFLEKSHASSGRIPTDMAFRMFLDEKVKNGLANSVQEVQIRQGIFRVRFDPEKMIKEILNILVEQSNAAAFVLMDDMTRHYGVSSLMNYEELRSVEAMQRVLDLLEDENLLMNVFNKYQSDDVGVLIGEELGIRDLADCSISFVKFKFWNNRVGHMGVLGSRRMDYRTVLPALRIVRNSVEEALQGWR